MLKKKSFAMSMYASEAALFRAKAYYYEQQAEKLEMALVVAQETLSHLEHTTLLLARDNDKLLESVAKMSEMVERLEQV